MCLANHFPCVGDPQGSTAGCKPSLFHFFPLACLPVVSDSHDPHIKHFQARIYLFFLLEHHRSSSWSRWMTDIYSHPQKKLENYHRPLPLFSHAYKALESSPGPYSFNTIQTGYKTWRLQPLPFIWRKHSQTLGDASHCACTRPFIYYVSFSCTSIFMILFNLHIRHNERWIMRKNSDNILE